MKFVDCHIKIKNCRKIKCKLMATANRRYVKLPSAGLDRLVMTPNISRVAFKFLSKVTYQDNSCHQDNVVGLPADAQAVMVFAVPSRLITVKPNSFPHHDSARPNDRNKVTSVANQSFVRSVGQKHMPARS
jgi:hypothetical protein